MNHYIVTLLIIVVIIPAGFFSQAQGQAAEMLTQKDGDVVIDKRNSQTDGSQINLPEDRPEVLVVGGGSSHNFERWFNLADSKILSDAGANVRYTDNVKYIQKILPELDILYLSNNQPLPDPSLRGAIVDFVESGNDLLLVHAAIWYNWDDWPEYNQKLVGGGSRGHDEFGSFEVQVVNDTHPIMEGVSGSFQITDELYYFENDEDGSEVNVLAKGIEPETNNEFPVVWTVNYGKGQILCITLGHDDKAHNHPAYKTLLQNSVIWFNQN